MLIKPVVLANISAEITRLRDRPFSLDLDGSVHRPCRIQESDVAFLRPVAILAQFAAPNRSVSLQLVWHTHHGPIDHHHHQIAATTTPLAPMPPPRLLYHYHITTRRPLPHVVAVATTTTTTTNTYTATTTQQQ